MTPRAKQLLIELHTGCNSKTKEKLEQEFPELFKPFKNGEWIKRDNAALVRITDFENSLAYGFQEGEWREKSKHYNFKAIPNGWQKATEAEVITAFEKEFKKRGFKGGIKFKDPECGTVREFNGLDFEHFFNENISKYEGQVIYSNNMYIYQDGVFAKIVEKPKTLEQRIEAAFIDVFDKAACIQHWNCRGKNDEGMVVSSKHVHELWEVLEKYKSLRHSL